MSRLALVTTHQHILASGRGRILTFTRPRSSGKRLTGRWRDLEGGNEPWNIVHFVLGVYVDESISCRLSYCESTLRRHIKFGVNLWRELPQEEAP